MKERFRLVRLGDRGGMFYCKDTVSGSRTTLKTKDRETAKKLIRHKNEAVEQPHIRLYIKQGNDIISQALLAHIDSHAERIKTFDAPLKAMLARYPDARLLMTIPGVGFLTALTVVAEADDMRRFRDAGKLASFAGLVPSQRSSGDSVRFGHVTNRGSRMLRTAVTEAAMRIRETNAPKLYGYYERLAAAKTKKQARVALARQLLAVMWAMVRTQTPFQEQTAVSTQSSLSAAR
jgi:transposase